MDQNRLAVVFNFQVNVPWQSSVAPSIMDPALLGFAGVCLRMSSFQCSIDSLIIFSKSISNSIFETDVVSILYPVCPICPHCHRFFPYHPSVVKSEFIFPTCNVWRIRHHPPHASVPPTRRSSPVHDRPKYCHYCNVDEVQVIIVQFFSVCFFFSVIVGIVLFGWSFLWSSQRVSSWLTQECQWRYCLKQSDICRDPLS